MARVCSLDCAKSLAISIRLKEEKKNTIKEKREDKKKRESLKTRSDYIKEAQREFNRYIRFRDAGKPCICCDAPLSRGGAGHMASNGPSASVGGEFDCGHYRSVGSAPHLRFDERNAHGQTKQCNRYGSGRAVDYRKGLIRRIGLSAVEELESDQAPKHYSIEDLKAIKAEYRRKARELEKADGRNDAPH
jgi:hypothetical protein